MSDTNNIPPRLEELIEDFEILEGQEKLMYLLELSEQLPDLPPRLQEKREAFGQVHECMSPVFILSELEDGRLRFYFDIPREAPTVRGYGMILYDGLDNLPPEEILQVPNEFYMALGLQKVMTGQRLNGMGAILRYMKNLAADAQQKIEAG